MWNFQTLSRPTYNHGFGGYQGFVNRNGSEALNRADGGSMPNKSDMMTNAAIYKGSAIATSTVAGAISAYKGMPEIKGFMGFDALFGLLGTGYEFWRMYNGKFDKITASIGGTSLGLLCHWGAVNGTVWGAAKSSSDDSDATSKGWDYGHDDTKSLEGDRRVNHEPPRENAKTKGRSFDTWNGEF